MVARIKFGRSIRGALNYNEHKVAKGVAELILASGFSTDINTLGFSQKLRRFERLIERADHFRINTMHLSLNFPPDEQLTDQILQQLAREYMERIGFGQQPFLVYKHNDAHHPHIHIVTTTIQDTGEPLDLHYIGKRYSEPARKALEEKYGLISAESRKKNILSIPRGPTLLPGQYTKSETKATISNIVREITSTYTYGSLEELNAILKQFNVTADRGAIGSPMYQNRGLVYSLLDPDGFKTGVPIKASEIYTQPTLAFLEKGFAKNQVKKMGRKDFAANTVNQALTLKLSPQQFLEYLRKRNIRVHPLLDSPGRITGMAFVDLRNRAVFTNEELGHKLTTLMDQLTQTKKSDQKESNNINAQVSTGQSTTPAFPLTIVQSLFATTSASFGGGGGEYPIKRKKKRKRPSL